MFLSYFLGLISVYLRFVYRLFRVFFILIKNLDRVCLRLARGLFGVGLRSITGC